MQAMHTDARFKVEERHHDKYIILHPKGAHSHTLIWLHGLGDSAEGFADTFLDRRFNLVPETCKVILPTAPQREVTCNGGYVMTSWYDIISLDRKKMSLADNHNNYNQKQLMDSVGIVSKIIDSEAASLGSSKKVFVGGFSQGCAVTLATLISYPQPIGGIVALSGAQSLKVDDWSKVEDFKKETPIFLYHGGNDSTIPVALAKMTYDQMIGEGGFKTQLQVEAGLAHSLSMAEIQKVAGFLGKLMM